MTEARRNVVEQTRVEATLIDDAGDTILTLRRTGIPTAFAGMHATSWSHFLPLLVKVAVESEIA